MCYCFIDCFAEFINANKIDGGAGIPSCFDLLLFFEEAAAEFGGTLGPAGSLINPVLRSTATLRCVILLELVVRLLVLLLLEEKPTAPSDEKEEDGVIVVFGIVTTINFFASAVAPVVVAVFEPRLTIFNLNVGFAGCTGAAAAAVAVF